MKTLSKTQSFNDPLETFLAGEDLDVYRGLNPKDVSRRKFIKLTGVAGGGLVLAFTLTPKFKGAAAKEAMPKNMGADLNAYVQVRPDGKIRIYSKNPEIGQGIKTGLPLIIAEELDASWSDVVVENAPVAPRFGGQFAGGSLSTPMNFQPMRVAGATAALGLVPRRLQQFGLLHQGLALA